MADWSINNLACTSTWMALRILEQSRKVFRTSGVVRMDQLAFWSAAASGEMRELMARTLARQMDNVFRLVDGATLETGVKPAQAVGAIADTLLLADATMADLAGVNDRNYRFFGELP